MAGKADYIFGMHPVIEAIQAGKSIDKILLNREVGNQSTQELTELIKLHEIAVSRVPIEKLNRITRKNHQGVIAFVSPVEFQPLDGIIAQVYEAGEVPLLLVLDEVSDVRNFGAIARTAECAGAHALVVPKKGAAAINADAVKTSAGALFNISVCKVDGIPAAIRLMQENGVQVVACTEKTNDSLYDLDLTVPTAVIMGNEETGISPTALRKSDRLGHIPLAGETRSLNVSVATGIALYEAVRQRLQPNAL